MANNYRKNRTKSALLSGKTIKVPEINRVFDPTVVETIASVGYQCVWIDMEHSHADFRDLSTLILAARTWEIDVFVRIPHGPYNQVIKTLELGASGLIWPHCKSREEAKAFVEMAKYHPEGMRGMGGGRDSFFGKSEKPAYFDIANENVLLGVMIEDKEGVELTLKSFESSLDKFGIRPIYPVNEQFDPIKHEAVMTSKDPKKENNEIENIFQRGWELHDRVVRPARVSVIKN